MELQIKTKRVYEPFDENDGFRVLTDRLWPKGIRKENLKLDLWKKDIAPSRKFRQWMHSNKTDRWEQFVLYYTQ